MQYVRANYEMECFRGRIGWMLDFDENYGSDVRNLKGTCKFIVEVSQRRVNMATNSSAKTTMRSIFKCGRESLMLLGTTCWITFEGVYVGFPSL